MRCPYCSSEDTKVVDKRNIENRIRRRRECLGCSKRFTTYEHIETVDLFVVKKDGRREEFDREKLRRGLIKATEKRPVSAEQIEHTITEIENTLRNQESTEIKSELIGELVMDKLKKLDKVAYIRFSSVYRDFADISSFEKALKQLKKEG